ncbi:DUF1361 domain-containing protein [Paenibacillus koleovorans]|uniref:DUF1361 domain-containing protein n=1 Tax=Paenibacillus koleovorans TaxID=121608 RepID=UPI000FD74685|nr:DUF1361 domain-containing protein [Paenibacillus koleovorans]
MAERNTRAQGQGVLQPSYRIFIVLFLCSCICAGLFATRVVVMDAWTYRWLIVPNLMLAWIPFLLSEWIGRSYWTNGRVKATTWLLGVVWLFFYPNCSYILTDIAHVGYFSRGAKPTIAFYDLTLNVMTAITAWLLGVFSLYRLHGLVLRAMGNVTAHTFAAVILGLSSIGVYMGRFLRWNSWDLFTRPVHVLTSTLEALVQQDALLFVTSFGLLIGGLYAALYIWNPHPTRTAEGDV